MKKYISSAFLCLIALTPVPGQIDRSKAPEPDPAPEINVGDYSSFELKNGLKVFVVENHKIPRITYSLILDIDPFMEGDSMGYSSIAGDMLGTATATRNKDQIDEAVDFIGATLYSTAGSVFGASLKKHNDKLLELMSDVLLNPVFKQEELDKIKKQTISTLAANKKDPSAISSTVTHVLLFGKDHPYGEVATEKTVETVTLEMCRNYIETYFRPNVAYLAIVGDVNLKEAKKLTKKYFGNWQPGDVPSHACPAPESPAGICVSVVDRPHAVQSVISFAHTVNYRLGDPDYLDARVMNTLLGGTFNRLDQNLREHHAYTYGVNSTLNQDKWIGNFNVLTDVRNEVTDSAVYQILYEIKRIRDEAASPGEVEKVKNYMTGTFALALEQPGTVARFALNIARYDLPADYYSSYLKRLSQVTPESVQAAAQKYLDPENVYVLVVGKSGEISGGLAGLASSGKINYYDEEGNLLGPESLIAELPAGISAEQVIDKYLEAIGGRMALQEIKDLSVSMEMEMQGMVMNSEILRKAPNKMKITTRMGDMLVQLVDFDGAKGTTSGMAGEKVLDGKNLESIKEESLFLPELDYPGNGFSLKLVSTGKVEGKSAYKIEKTYSSGTVSYDFYDMQTGLKLQEEKTEVSPQGNIQQVVSYSDYRDVDGVLYPHSMSIMSGPQTISVKVTSVRFNSGIPDSTFEN